MPFLYSSEIFPQVLRGKPNPFERTLLNQKRGIDYGDTEVGMAWASAVSWMGAGILDLCVPALIRELGQTGLLCLFA